jgi:hypothetical protein
VSVTRAANRRRRWLEKGRAATKLMGGAANNWIQGEDAASLVALVEAEENDMKLHAVQVYKFLFDLTDGGNWLVGVHASS